MGQLRERTTYMGEDNCLCRRVTEVLDDGTEEVKFYRWKKALEFRATLTATGDFPRVMATYDNRNQAAQLIGLLLASPMYVSGQIDDVDVGNWEPVPQEIGEAAWANT